MLQQYQVAIILMSFTFIEACQPPPCHWSNEKPATDYFDGLANTLIAAEKRTQRFCYNYNGRQSKEIFGKKFRYIFPVERYHAADFTVMIKNRVLFIHGNSCEKIFAEVRIIPDFLNVYGATWAYQNEEVVVTFPYLFNKNVGRLSLMCHPHDSNVITVPKEDNVEVYGSSK